MYLLLPGLVHSSRKFPVTSRHPLFNPSFTIGFALILVHANLLLVSNSQLIENARRQSVDGLALPFLANWFLGLSAVHRVPLLPVD